MKRYLLLLSVVLIGFWGCESDPTSPPNDDDEKVSLNGVYIINEGGFGKSNASLSFLDSDKDKIFNNIYKTANGEDLGDVAQSMTIIDTLGYIVVNNSNKIKVISLKTHKRKAVIDMPPGSSPRYLVKVSDEFAYVTNLFGNNVSIIKLSDNRINGSIPVGSNPEQIAVVSGKAYVANSGFGSGNTVSVIDVAANKVIHTLTVGDNPRFIKVSPQNEVQVLCSGGYGDFNDPNDDTDGGIYVIDPNSNTVVDSLIISGHPSGLALNSGTTGYFLNGGCVISYDTQKRTVINDTLIAGFFYGLAVDISNDQIYALDAKDFVQQGELLIYDAQGVLKNSYDVGIIPGSVTFNYEN
jgi:YVTN family beta-propeller protein